MAQKPWKGDFGDLKSKTFPWEACFLAPARETCAFGARLGNRPVFNVDSRLRFRFGCCNTLQEVICFVLWCFLSALWKWAVSSEKSNVQWGQD